MTVSILAGPASALLLRQLEPGVGVLANSTVLRDDDRRHRYELPPNSSPGQILDIIRGIGERKELEHLVICCEPERPPMAYASLFMTGDGEVGRLTATAFAIDATAFLDLILARSPEAEGACFMAEQVE